jgi:hypothetical protein
MMEITDVLMQRLDELELRVTALESGKQPAPVVPVIPVTPTEPKPQYQDAATYWKTMCAAPVGTRTEIPGWGYMVVAVQYGFTLIEWHCDRIKDSPEWLGPNADMIRMRRVYREGLDALFTPACGPDWHIGYNAGSETGLTSEGTGIPGYLPCGRRKVNGLK